MFIIQECSQTKSYEQLRKMEFKAQGGRLQKVCHFCKRKNGSLEISRLHLAKSESFLKNGEKCLEITGQNFSEMTQKVCYRGSSLSEITKNFLRKNFSVFRKVASPVAHFLCQK